MHCRKLKCIHYSSSCFRLFTLYYKNDSFCATCTTYNPGVYVDAPLPYSLITNIATQFLGGNLLRNLFDILHLWDTECYEQYSISYFNVIYMCIFWLENIFLTLRSDCHITSDHTFGKKYVFESKYMQIYCI